jgi:hypothetical protein
MKLLQYNSEYTAKNQKTTECIILLLLYYTKRELKECMNNVEKDKIVFPSENEQWLIDEGKSVRDEC